MFAEDAESVKTLQGEIDDGTRLQYLLQERSTDPNSKKLYDPSGEQIGRISEFGDSSYSEIVFYDEDGNQVARQNENTSDTTSYRFRNALIQELPVDVINIDGRST